MNHQELASAIAGEVLKILKPLFEKGTGEDKIFSVKEVAEYLGVSEDLVHKKIKFFEIPFFKIGDLNRFKKSQVDKWIETQTRKPVPSLKVVK
ncbi:MAG: excisionase family DNA-binding protein [Deltaproteobacteria bacterium]|nr:excisionase family DNA-binding protein [Deltaproteobacteria bacterium]